MPAWIWLYEQPDMLAISKKLKGFTGRRDEYMLKILASPGASYITGHTPPVTGGR